MERLCKFVSLAAASGLIGCATASPPLPSVTFAGTPYIVHDEGGAEGRISGRVCGVNVELSADRAAPGAVTLSGFLDGNMPARLEARDAAGVRRIQGALGTRLEDSAVDLTVERGRLSGRVGARRFDLAAIGDRFAGKVSIAGAERPIDAVVHGRAALEAMPLGDQAAVLPMLLTCYVAHLGPIDRAGPLVVGIGGAEGDAPHGTSSLYHH